jgi:nucleoside triphosphate pyrophosphatase
MNDLRLILASTSPRRKHLLESLGIRFDVIAPDIDEHRHPNEEPFDYVVRIARAKAESAVVADAVVVAADTVVVIDGQVLGKPGHPEEAKTMLRRLGGVTHEVLTGVAVARLTDIVQVLTAVESILVKFLPMTDDEIADYVATGEPMDKAGAYALGGLGAIYVEAVHGSPSGVIGLPVHTTARLLRSLGVDLLSFR